MFKSIGLGKNISMPDLLSLWGLLSLGAAFLCLEATAAPPRDPTRPLEPVAAKKSAVELQLHSILISDSRRVAIINGKSVKENDSINGAKIVKILPGKVVVRQNGAEKSLILHRSVKKQASG